MTGHYKIALGADENAAENRRVKALLRALPPGAQYTIEVRDKPITLGLVVKEDRGRERTQQYGRYVEIRAHGGTEKRSKPKAARAVAPAALTVEQVTKRHGEALAQLRENRRCLALHLRRQWCGEAWYPEAWRERMEQAVGHRARRRAIGRAVARILSTHKAGVARARHIHFTAGDYARLDVACGRKVERESRVSATRLAQSEGGYLGWIVSTYAKSYGFGREKPPKVDELNESPGPVTTFLGVKAEVEYLAELLRLATEREAAKPARHAPVSAVTEGQHDRAA